MQVNIFLKSMSRVGKGHEKSVVLKGMETE